MKVYCTLLTSDSYVEGALVLCHMLKKHGTKYSVSVLYTEDDLSVGNVSRMEKAFDNVHPIRSIHNPNPKHLSLMARPDLLSTITKIALWSLTQYDQILYLDADTLPLRSPDELFLLDDIPFAAAPEVGFPDCFNSGVMLLRPSSAVFSHLLDMAEAGRTFDGGDQGLLNLYFGDRFHRLSFLYNIALYSAYHLYMPGLKSVRGNWSIAHFLGKKKPWDWEGGKVELDDDTAYAGLYTELVGMWWKAREDIETQNSEQLPREA